MTTARLAPPWYVHPAEDPGAWQLLGALHPRPSFVVVNVHDGPGRPGDPWYPTALASLRGMRVLGYVDVAYGTRPPRDLGDDVRAWLDRYGVGGVMLDQVPADAGSTKRVGEYVLAARRAGAGFVVGNPGVQPSLGHLAMLDVTCVFEGPAVAYAEFRPSAALARVPRARVWHLVHSCPSGEVSGVTARSTGLGAGHAFVTDRVMPHPWAGFPLASAPEPAATGT